jgi:tripartite-type tricarboxylate transporter receptor subunit TctC
MAKMATPIKYLDGSELDKFLEQDQKRLSKVIKVMGKLE